MLGSFHHQLHHRHYDCNYGTPFMLSDRWFGTETEPRNGTAERRNGGTAERRNGGTAESMEGVRRRRLSRLSRLARAVS